MKGAAAASLFRVAALSASASRFRAARPKMGFRRRFSAPRSSWVCVWEGVQLHLDKVPTCILPWRIPVDTRGCPSRLAAGHNTRNFALLEFMQGSFWRPSHCSGLSDVRVVSPTPLVLRDERARPRQRPAKEFITTQQAGPRFERRMY